MRSNKKPPEGGLHWEKISLAISEGPLHSAGKVV